MFGPFTHPDNLWGGLRTEPILVPTPALIQKVAELLGKLYDDGFEHPSTCVVRPTLFEAKYGTVQFFDEYPRELPPKGIPRMSRRRTYQFATRRYIVREGEDIDALLIGMRAAGEHWRVVFQEEDPDALQRHTFWNVEDIQAIRSWGETCALVTVRTYTAQDQEALDFMRTLPVAKREEVVISVPELPQESDDEE